MGYDRNDTETPNYVVEDMANTIQSLRAEVASLKETETAYYRLLELESSDVMVETLNRIDALSQQLSATKEYAERLREALERLHDFAGTVAGGASYWEDCDLSEAALSLPKPWE